MILVWSVVQQGIKFCRSSIIGVGYKIFAVDPLNVLKLLNLRILVRMERSGTGSAWATASISIDNHFLRSIKEKIYIAIHKLCRDIPRWDTSPSNQSVTSWVPIHKMKNLECIVDYLILSETFLNSKMGSGPAYWSWSMSIFSFGKKKLTPTKVRWVTLRIAGPISREDGTVTVKFWWGGFCSSPLWNCGLYGPL